MKRGERESANVEEADRRRRKIMKRGRREPNAGGGE